MRVTVIITPTPGTRGRHPEVAHRRAQLAKDLFSSTGVEHEVLITERPGMRTNLHVRQWSPHLSCLRLGRRRRQTRLSADTVVEAFAAEDAGLPPFGKPLLGVENKGEKDRREKVKGGTFCGGSHERRCWYDC